MKKHKLGKKIRKQKKAQIATQFNWIFIVIVGALILGFFIYIVIHQKGASEQKFSAKVSQQMQSVFIGAGVATGTVQEIAVPNVEIEFTCNDYYIGPAAQRLGNAVVFAPASIKGTQMITWTLEWDVPFKVMNFLYITSPLVRYIIVYDDQPDNQNMKNYMERNMPEAINKEFVNIVDINNYLTINNLNDNKIRFVFLTAESPDGPSFKDVPPLLKGEDISAVHKSGASEITFYRAENDEFSPAGVSSTFPYLDHESFFGAVFSEEPDTYECLMDRAYNRLGLLCSIYRIRFEKLKNSVSDVCKGLYSVSDIEQLKGASVNWQGNQDTIRSKMSTFRNINQNAQLKSCPLLY